MTEALTREQIAERRAALLEYAGYLDAGGYDVGPKGMRNRADFLRPAPPAEETTDG